MPDTNKGLAERVEVFTRATSDALQKAVGEVLDAKGPWQLLYRLSRIVLLGLVLYTAWLLITLQPDLAKRMSTTTAQTLQEQVAARQTQIQALLRSAIEANRSGLHTLALLQWDGGSSVTVLAADGRSGQLALTPGQQPLLGIEMAEALGHVALGLCASEGPGSLPITVPTPAGSDGVLLLCPVGCSGRPSARALLLGLHDPPANRLQGRQARGHGPDRQQEQLLLIARRLGQLLDGG
ncbi:MAG: hypothetical protein ACNA8O_12365 [Cyanobacteriota bacterium]